MRLAPLSAVFAQKVERWNANVTALTVLGRSVHQLVIQLALIVLLVAGLVGVFHPELLRFAGRLDALVRE